MSNSPPINEVKRPVRAPLIAPMIPPSWNPAIAPFTVSNIAMITVIGKNSFLNIFLSTPPILENFPALFVTKFPINFPILVKNDATPFIPLNKEDMPRIIGPPNLSASIPRAIPTPFKLLSIKS